jgi:PAS domain S-box-containing protein
MSLENLFEAKGLQSSNRLIYGDGQMADRIRAFDWAATPLGPIAQWSETLRSSVNLVLACSFPSLVFWGEHMIQIYNDAFAPLLADRHPRALGRTAEEFWAEAWHIVGPNLKRVISTAETINQKNAIIPILREGRLQDVCWTYNYSPIFLPDGKVEGIFTICHDVTAETNAVQDLKESQARALRILESIGDAVIVTDADTNIMQMNPVAERLTAWLEEEAQGKPLSEIFHIVNETTRKPVESPADKVRALGSVVGLANHTVLIARDGQETPIDDSGAPIRNDDGELSGIVLVFRDISQRRAAEREKERITEQLSQVMEATTDAIVGIDRNWVISYLNRRATELYASDREILGQGLWEMFPSALYEGSPYLYHFNCAMNDGVGGSFEAYYPDPLNAWLRIEVFPTKDGIVTFSRDVTQERAAQESLRQKSEETERQRAEIETVYRTAPIGLALFDTKDFRYLRLNDRQAEFFGLKPDQIVGRTLTEMAPIEGLKELFDQVLAGTPVINYPLEGTLVTDPTVHRYWTVSYFPVFAVDGSIQAITAASLEVTQQKKTEMALIQSEKLAVAGRLAASIAHEINNPLEAVTNLLYLAQTSDSPTEVKECIDLAERELRRVAAITNQTLRFHKQLSKPQQITCQVLIEDVLSMFHGRLEASGIQVEARQRASAPVRCFEGEIRQVISNLVGNAIDAMHPLGGRLLVRSRNGTNWKNGEAGVVLTVADTGSGISPSSMSRIYEPFYTTKEIGGTGLGLWVSAEIVNRHGGRLRVRSSQKEGCSGTTFTLYLPLNAVHS